MTLQKTKHGIAMGETRSQEKDQGKETSGKREGNFKHTSGSKKKRLLQSGMLKIV